MFPYTYTRKPTLAHVLIRKQIIEENFGSWKVFALTKIVTFVIIVVAER